jgi:hypothetical protein
MPLAVGMRLGPYEILAPLGAGGMGEVYRARDTRLGRDVALKILPEDVANDPGRRQRFELEARAVAALNHPNIVAIYDVGEGYIVSELVDGESLRGAAFGLRKTIDIAVQIAGGLAAAHAASIVHRDLKPENILFTREGRVKILDFGLAKMAGSRAHAAATATMTVHTEPGVVMGTVGYMSPEQIRGAAADHRSDIFNLGLILYELLAGKRPFSGETSVETMTAILKQDAPELPERVPAGVRQIVAHCLEKEPANRFQSAKDLAFALSQFERPSGTAATQAVRIRAPWKAIAALVAGAAIALAVLVGHFLWRGPQPQEWTGIRLGGPEMALNPRVSPDGHLLAFQAMEDGLTQVALMKPESGNWSILTHRRDHGGIAAISWSPDGTQIYYDRISDAPAGIYSIPVLGGTEHLVLPNAMLPEILPDGSLLAARLNAQQQHQLFRFWPETGRSQDLPLLVRFVLSSLVRATADGKRAIAYAVHVGETTPALFALDLASNAVKRVTPAAHHDENIIGWGPTRDGKTVLAAMRAATIRRVVAISVDGSAAERTLFTTNSDVYSVEPGPDGSVYVNLVERPAEVLRLAANGGPGERIAAFPELEFPEMILRLPDGRIVAPVAMAHTRLMAFDPGKEAVPFLNTAEETGGPLTLAGPREVAFGIGPVPRQTIAIADLESGRISRRIAPGKGGLISLAAMPDGKMLYFAAGGSIWSVPSSGGDAKLLCGGNSAVMEPSGRSLIVQRLEAAHARLFRVPLTGGAEQEIPPDALFPTGGSPLGPGAMDAGGRLLVSLSPLDSWFNPLGILDTATGRITRVPGNELSDHLSAVWAPDGRIIAVQVGLRATLWKFTLEDR